MQKAALRKEEENTIFYLETTPRFWKTKTRNAVTSEEQKWSCNNIPAAKADDCSLQGQWESNPQQTLGAKMRRLRGGQDSCRSQKKRRSCHQQGSRLYQPLFWLLLEYLSLTISSTSFVAKYLLYKTGFDNFKFNCLEFQQLRTNKYPKYTLCFVFVIGY